MAEREHDDKDGEREDGRDDLVADERRGEQADGQEQHAEQRDPEVAGRTTGPKSIFE